MRPPQGLWGQWTWPSKEPTELAPPTGPLGSDPHVGCPVGTLLGRGEEQAGEAEISGHRTTQKGSMLSVVRAVCFCSYLPAWVRLGTVLPVLHAGHVLESFPALVDLKIMMSHSGSLFESNRNYL